MGLKRLDWALAAGTALALGGSLFVARDHGRPNYEFFPDMARTARYGAFEQNPHFADGKTLQAPQSGTVARGPLPLHYGTTPEEALRAGRELSDPFAGADADTLAAAAQRG